MKSELNRRMAFAMLALPILKNRATMRRPRRRGRAISLHSPEKASKKLLDKTDKQILDGSGFRSIIRARQQGSPVVL